MRFAEGDRLLSAKAAVGGYRRARAARQHDAGHRVIQIQVLARDAVDVLDRHALDALEVLIGGSQAVERERIGPDRGELRDGVALQLRGAALLKLRGLHQLRRNPLVCNARQDRPYVALERFGILAAREGDYRGCQTGLRQGVEFELGPDGLALGNESVQIKALTAEHVRQYFQRREIAIARSGRARRDHQRAARMIGIHSE
jgi:hypothetical protein